MTAKKMTANVSLRNNWARGIYSNFSSHDCIRHEVEMLAKAYSTNDELLVKYLEINIRRRKKRTVGLNTYNEYKALEVLFEEHKNASNPSDAYLAAMAARSVACAVMSITKRKELFFKAKEIVEQQSSKKGALAKETISSIESALINEKARDGADLDVLLQDYDNLFSKTSDYLPAYFDRASHGFKTYNTNLNTSAPENIISLFEGTVKAAAVFNSIKLPALDDDEAIEHCIATSCLPSSALPLAFRQFKMAHAFCYFECDKTVKLSLLSTIGENDRSRFDQLI